MKIKTLTLVGLFSLSFLFCSWGQENKYLDSLLIEYRRQANDTVRVNTLQKLYSYYLNFQLDSARKYNQEKMQLSLQLNFKKGIGYAHMNAGVLAAYSGKIDSAMSQYSKAKVVFREIEDYRMEAWALKNIATCEHEKGNQNKALQILDEAFEVYNKSESSPDGLALFYGLKANIHHNKGNYKIATAETIKQLKIVENIDGIAKAGALYQLGGLASSQGHYENAIKYLLESAEVYKKVNDKTFELQSLIDIGWNYNALKNYQKAIEHLEKCRPVAEEQDDPWMTESLIRTLGAAYIGQNRIDEGIILLLEAVDLAKTMEVEDKVMEGYNQLGYAYYKKENYRKAISYFDQIITEIDSTNSKGSLSYAYFKRSESYERLKNYKLALEDFKKFNTLKDTVYNVAKSQQIEELNTIYETEKKEQQIAFQEKEITVLEQEAKISNQQRWLLGGGMSLSILALGFGFYGFRQKSRRNQLEKDKVEAELAFKKKELTTHALHLAKKNEVLENVKLKAKDLKLQGDTKGYQELIKTINFDQQDDKNWESFTQYFEQVHKDFAKNVKNKYPDVTKNELRFMALLKMNMSSKEIATILNISPDGIKKARQRLRKKMALTPEISLENTVLAI